MISVETGVSGNPATVPAGLNTLTAPTSVNRPAQVVSDTRTFYDDPTFATAFPQPAPGTADSPGPMKNVPAEKLRSMLGLTTVRVRNRQGPLAVVDSNLS